MKTILVTGSDGFFGRNLCVALSRCEGMNVLRFDVHNTLAELEQQTAQADFIFHLAGVNRPKEEKEFAEGNTDLTRLLCDFAEKHNCRAPILLSSSTQAASDNAYGRSKRAAEDVLIDYSRRTGIPVFVYRFPNLFGKWSRPNYNSVVSTFCYNVTHDLPIQVNDPSHTVTFAYVDDVVDACLRLLQKTGDSGQRSEDREPGIEDRSQYFYEIRETYCVSLGRLAGLVKAFRAVRDGGPMPDLSDPFTKKLYATFLSYYETNAFAYSPKMNVDNRGWLFELIKSEQFGQIFISTTHPGITRGNHGHNTKVEKFCVIQGRGVIRFRHVVTNEICAYDVSGENIRIVDIPPGYTHSVENTGDTEMITLFWANEIFNPQKPDTYYEEVLARSAQR
jgi:UDP-2-acetamido-2,6-beta-L-arabino-hexul-4-ose reductase